MADEKTRDVTGQYETPVELVRRAEIAAAESLEASAPEPAGTLAEEGSGDRDRAGENGNGAKRP